MGVMRKGGPPNRTAAWLLAGAMGLASAHLSAQGPATPVSEPPSPISAEDLSRVRKALETPSTLNLDENRLRYYVRVLARKASIMDLMAGYDFRNGPTKRGN